MSIKSNILQVFDAVGFNRISRLLNKDRTVVLMYHGVVKDDWEIADGNWLQVKESEFRKQMEHLKEHYHVVSLSEALAAVGRKYSKPRVVITFDDGYENNYTVAYPILKELGLPATIFLVSSMIDSRTLFWYDRLRSNMLGHEDSDKIESIIQSMKTYHPHEIDHKVDTILSGRYECKYPHQYDAYGTLNIDQIHVMQDEGLIDFDSHTERHEILTQLVDDEAETSIGRSLEQLRARRIKCGRFFCYPNGCFDPDYFSTVIKLGFIGAVSTINDCWGPADNHYAIPRFGVGRQLELIQFKSLTSGLWKCLGNVSQKIKRAIRR